MRFVFPAVSVLVGLFFFIIPFVGRSTQVENHNTATSLLAWGVGALFLILGGYHLIKEIRK